MDRITPEAVQNRFLQHAAPEVVYEYLLQYFEVEQEGSIGGLSEFLGKMLLDRGNPIIDLAIAKVSHTEEIIIDILSREDPYLRTAAFSNQNIDFGSWDPNYAMSYTPGSGIIRDLLQHGEWSELEAFFSNPRFNGGALADLFKREGSFSDLNEERWHGIVRIALCNPALKNYKEFPDYGSYVVEESIFQLPLTVETTPAWAYTLKQGFVDLDIGSAIFPEDKVYLQKVFERWKTPDEEEGEHSYILSSNFDELREAIASKVSEYETDMIRWMLDHGDVWVRRGAYQIFSPENPEQLEMFYNKDAISFLQPAMKNPYLFSKSIGKYSKTKIILVKFYDLVQSPGLDYEKIPDRMFDEYHRPQYEKKLKEEDQFEDYENSRHILYKMAQEKESEQTSNYDIVRDQSEEQATERKSVRRWMWFWIGLIVLFGVYMYSSFELQPWIRNW